VKRFITKRRAIIAAGLAVASFAAYSASDFGPGQAAKLRTPTQAGPRFSFDRHA
jgi:hypothetical protein